MLMMRRSEKAEALRKIPIFASLGNRHLNLIARSVDEAAWRRASYLPDKAAWRGKASSSSMDKRALTETAS